MQKLHVGHAHMTINLFAESVFDRKFTSYVHYHHTSVTFFQLCVLWIFALFFCYWIKNHRIFHADIMLKWAFWKCNIFEKSFARQSNDSTKIAATKMTMYCNCNCNCYRHCSYNVNVKRSHTVTFCHRIGLSLSLSLHANQNIPLIGFNYSINSNDIIQKHANLFVLDSCNRETPCAHSIAQLFDIT